MSRRHANSIRARSAPKNSTTPPAAPAEDFSARVTSHMDEGQSDFVKLFQLHQPSETLHATLNTPRFRDQFHATCSATAVQIKLMASSLATLALEKLAELMNSDKPEVARRAATTILSIAGVATATAPRKPAPAAPRTAPPNVQPLPVALSAVDLELPLTPDQREDAEEAIEDCKTQSLPLTDVFRRLHQILTPEQFQLFLYAHTGDLHTAAALLHPFLNPPGCHADAAALGVRPAPQPSG